MESHQNSHLQKGTYIQAHILRRYNILKKVGSGAYGHVWKVEDKLTKKIYALKKIFDAFQHSTDAQRTYRQIQILRQTQHPNIIKLIQTIKADNNKDVYLVFEFMEADLHNVIAEGILKQVHIKFIIYQIAKALKYLHSGKIIHRDLKPSNVLINSNCSIKLCDFGLVRSLVPMDDSSVPTLTQGVATRWYRAPQVLLGSKSYSNPADIWSFGCIIYEILAQKPLFPGNSTVDQIDKILMLTGYPKEEDINSLQSEIAQTMLKQSKISSNTNKLNLFKDFDPLFTDLLNKIIVFNPTHRITTEDILSHEIVKPFRKKEEEVECGKEIRTSVDDNKKLTVEEYRNFVYGSKRTHTPQMHSKADTPVKKSNSYGKLSSGSSYTSKTSLSDKIQRDKQYLKYTRSTKDLNRPINYYNKSSSQLSSPEITQQLYQTQAHKLIKPRLSEQYGIDAHKFHYTYKNKGSEQLNTVGQRPPFSLNSPKTVTPGSQTQIRPIYKSSKYIISKTEANTKN